MRLPDKSSLVALHNREVMACHGFNDFIGRIDFSAMHEVEAFGEPGYSVENGVAIIKVRGLLVPDLGIDASSWGITGYDIVEKYIDNANQDGAVSEIVLDIDSPGGFVSGLGAVTAAIETSAKPIRSHATGDAYSAAYWLGVSASGGFTASPYSGVGSIGVYVEHFDESRALEDGGIKSSIFKSGFWKGAFSSYRPLSDREADRLQQDVDESARAFFDHVASKRSLTSLQVERLDGDFFSARRGLELGLIDAITENIVMTTDSSAAAAVDQSAQVATFTQEQVDAMVADAAAKAVEAANEVAEAKAKAQNERMTAINGHEGGTDSVKAALLGDEFASVSTESLVAVLDAMPKSGAAMLELVGGAGIGTDRNEFAPKPEAEKEDKQAKALEGLAQIKRKAF